MKIPYLLPQLVAAALVAGASAIALAADSGERTSMPNSCSERDANCVIQDGAPRRRGGGNDNTSSSSAKDSKDSSKRGDSKSKSGSDSSR